jgi:hypothetical protein
MIHLFRNWDGARLLRAGLAVAFLTQGFHAGDVFAYTVAALFGIQAAFGLSCGLGTCAPRPREGHVDTAETSFTLVTPGSEKELSVPENSRST